MRYLILIMLFVSCTTTKELLKTRSKENRTIKETETVIVKRPADTVSIKIPTYKYKDTTIVKRGKTNTLYLNYDKGGHLDAKCIGDELSEIRTAIREINESKKETIRDKTKKTIVNPINILYLFIGIWGAIIIFKKF